MTERQRALMAHNLYTTRYEGYDVTSWHQLRDCDQFPWLAAADEAWRLSEGFRLANARGTQDRPQTVVAA